MKKTQQLEFLIVVSFELVVAIIIFRSGTLANFPPLKYFQVIQIGEVVSIESPHYFLFSSLLVTSNLLLFFFVSKYLTHRAINQLHNEET